MRPLDHDLRPIVSEELEKLYIELINLQYWVAEKGKRIAILFEGRDTAGKGGAVFAFSQFLNPRGMRIDFTKMHGLGNDFIVFDLPAGASLPTVDQWRRLSNRHTGIGLQVAVPEQHVA